MRKIFNTCLFVLAANLSIGQQFDPMLYVPKIESYPAEQQKISYKWPHYNYVPKYVGLVIGYEGVRSSFYQMGLVLNLVEMEEMPGGMVGGQLLYKRHFNENIQSYSAEIGVYQVICGGINFNYHVQGDRSTFGVKPFIGLSIYHVQLMYGYNIYSNKNNEITPLKHASFELRYVIPIVSFGKNKDQMVYKSSNYPNRNEYEYGDWNGNYTF